MTANLRVDPAQLQIYRELYVNWAAGFLSGSNFHSAQTGQGNPNVGKNMSVDALMAATEQYCDQHPLDKVVAAVRDVYFQLAAR